MNAEIMRIIATTVLRIATLFLWKPKKKSDVNHEVLVEPNDLQDDTSSQSPTA